MSFPPEVSALDERQILQLVFDEDNRRLRTDSTATIVNADIDVALDATEDNVAIRDSAGDELNINPDGSINAVVTGNLDIEIDAADGDNIAISDGTDTLAINVDGSINITDNGASLTVDAVDLDIRDLTFAVDKVDVTGSEISLDAATLAALETITANQGTPNTLVNGWPVKITDGTDTALVTVAGELNVLATAQPGVDIGDITINNATGAAAVNIQDGGNSITVDASNLDIRDLVFATDKVDVSGSTVELGVTTLAALESITVVATDLDIRDLTHVSDSVKVGDGTDFLAVNTDGSVSSRILDSNGNGIDSTIDPIDGDRHLNTSIIQDISASTSNSSTTNLAPAATFTGTSAIISTCNSFSVGLFSDQNCLVQVQQSSDGTNWDFETKYTVLANTGQARVIQVIASFLRVLVTNISSTTTTVFRLQTVIIPVSVPNPPNLTSNREESGTITTACTDANINNCPPTAAIQINAEGAGTVIAQHLGTWDGVVVFDVSYDNGVTWEMQSSVDVSVNQLSDNMRFFVKWSDSRLNDRWAINCAGAQLVRLRASVLTSGTIPVILTASVATLYQNIPVRRNPTYSAGVISFTTAATATDIATLNGSATKVIKVTSVGYSSTQTSQDFENVTLIKRSTANTGGTSAVMTSVSYDSEDGASSAVARNYTANPTLGTSVGVLRPSRILSPQDPPLGSATAQCEKIWDFSPNLDGRKSLYLRGTAESLCINQNAVTFAGNVTSCYFEWTEE